MQGFFPYLTLFLFLLVGYTTKQFAYVSGFRIKWEATLLTYVFFIGTMTGLGVPLNLIKWINELLVILYLFRNYRKSKRVAVFILPASGIFLSISAIILVSFIINDSNAIDSFYFLRFYLSPMLFFWGVYNSNLNEIQIKKLNHYLFFLFTFQIVAQLLKSILWKGFPENPVGSITVAGGGIASFIPLFAFGFVLSFYFNYRNDKKYWLWLIGFVFIGIASQKRAAFYFLPIVAFSFLYLNQQLSHGRNTFKQIRIIFLISVLLPLLTFISASSNFILNQKIDKINLTSLIDYADEYSNSKNEKEGLVFGRISAFQRTVEIVNESDLIISLFGWGPSTVKGFSRGDMKMEKFGFGGTFPGWTYQYLQIGLLGCFFYLLLFWTFFKEIYKISRLERDPYWSSIEIGVLICIILVFTDFIIYSITSLTMYAITYPLFYMIAVIFKRKFRYSHA